MAERLAIKEVPFICTTDYNESRELLRDFPQVPVAHKPAIDKNIACSWKPRAI